jgi:hypothetical protein
MLWKFELWGHPLKPIRVDDPLSQIVLAVWGVSAGLAITKVLVCRLYIKVILLIIILNLVDITIKFIVSFIADSTLRSLVQQVFKIIWISHSPETITSGSGNTFLNEIAITGLGSKEICYLSLSIWVSSWVPICLLVWMRSALVSSNVLLSK